MTTRAEAQQHILRIKSESAQAEEDGDRVTARQLEVLAEFVIDKLKRGDYDE